MASAVDHSRLGEIYAEAKPRARKVKPLEHLDLFPVRLPRHRVPPLMSSEVHNVLPPMYILGWYYTMTNFGKRFGTGRPLIAFEERILEPYLEKYKGVPDIPTPLLSSDFIVKYCIVYVASNSNAASLDPSRVNLMIEGLRDILGEDAEPQWIRVPVTPL